MGPTCWRILQPLVGPRSTLSPLGPRQGVWNYPEATGERSRTLPLREGPGCDAPQSAAVSAQRSLAWSVSLESGRLVKVTVGSGTLWTSRNGVLGPVARDDLVTQQEVLGSRLPQPVPPYTLVSIQARTCISVWSPNQRKALCAPLAHRRHPHTHRSS